jgi:hypothetical protein
VIVRRRIGSLVRVADGCHGLVVALVLPLLLTVACTTRSGAASDAAMPAIPGQALPAANSDAVIVQIEDGQFDQTMYEQQTGDMQMIVRTSGGPYLFYIDDLVDKRELPEQGLTTISYSVSAPGRHTMHVALSTPTTASAAEASATLDVRPVGGR